MKSVPWQQSPCPNGSVVKIGAPDHAQQIRQVQVFTIVWMLVEVLVSSFSAWRARSPSVTGIVILLLAAAVMPLLARAKRKLSTVTGSAALRADAAESAVCAYLAVVALLGVGVNTVWHISWADPVAALAIVPFIIREGREAMRGKPCGCH